MRRFALAILVAAAAAAALLSQGRAESSRHVLALSWQPAFCETRPDTAECRALNLGRLPAAEARLSLHGLWPQPRGTFYCGVAEPLVRLDKAGRWHDLPPVDVDAETARALAMAMPGTASALDRHQWLKHGTCHDDPGGADAYYDDTLLLMAQVNGSPVAALLAGRRGGYLSGMELRAAFDAAFGTGAGDRVELRCTEDGERVLIQELRLHLRGVIGPETSLGPLLIAADPVAPGCGGGMVDAAGLQ